MMKNKLRWGTSGDAILLMLIKLVTIVLGFTVTRLLSEHLSVYDYGTYSQILLVVSTVTSLTILGMMDGVNYFYCSEQDPQKRESYISTIFALQCVVSAVAGSIVLLLSGPLCDYFENPDVGPLLVFAALLPLLQNLLSMVQVLLVSVGKAKMLAVRNLVVSLLRLAVVLVVVLVVQNVAIILATTVLLDLGQIVLFAVILRKNQCPIRLGAVKLTLSRSILRYCAPMAVFTAVSALNRDIDKYLIALMTDTETLAVYSNASKMLPFDILMASFCTVLIPAITRNIASDNRGKAAELYRYFLEIGYISTTISCCAALCAAPQLMELLYSEKYAGGLTVFCIYILVDLLHFTNITLVLSAAGKARLLMFFSIGALGANAVLNVLFYHLMGVPGPAVATVVTTALLGMCILGSGAKELGVRVRELFDLRYLALFVGENLLAVVILSVVQKWLSGLGVHYIVILVVVAAAYGGALLLLNGRRLFSLLKGINRTA